MKSFFIELGVALLVILGIALVAGMVISCDRTDRAKNHKVLQASVSVLESKTTDYSSVVEVIEVDGHKFIVVRAPAFSGGISVTHHPSCWDVVKP